MHENQLSLSRRQGSQRRTHRIEFLERSLRNRDRRGWQDAAAC
jgi:hypothetical protein